MDISVIPYVYKLVHKETGRFYFGYRRANKVPAIDDLGKKYFTSSKIVKPFFNEFTYEIIKEFINAYEAFWYEQKLIAENCKNPLILNRRFQRKDTKVFTFCGHHSIETKAKIALKQIGKKHTLDHSQKISNALKGRKLTTKELSTRKKQLPFSEETKKKMSQAKIGKVQSPEHIMKRTAKMLWPPRDNPCTIDNITIYRTQQELVKSLGQGKKGLKSPTFRFLK
jgi:hypothetical protein